MPFWCCHIVNKSSVATVVFRPRSISEATSVANQYKARNYARVRLIPDGLLTTSHEWVDRAGGDGSNPIPG
jgi:hypothetical protein